MRPVSEKPAAEADAEEQQASESVMIDVMASESADDLEARYRSRINQMLAAGLALLVERGYEAPAVLGVGRASIHVTNQVLEGGNASALVWVAPQFYPVDRPDLPERLESLGTELLELYPSGDVDDRSGWSVGTLDQLPGLLIVEQTFFGEVLVTGAYLLLGQFVRMALGYLLAVGPFYHLQRIPSGNP